MEEKGHIVEGRCEDGIWGRKEWLMLQRGRRSDQGERRERERHTERKRERAREREGIAQKYTSLKPLTGKTRGDDNHRFLQTAELKV